MSDAQMSEKERNCRIMFAAQGCDVLRFWLDDEGFGCAVIRDHNGKERTFSQNPKSKLPDHSL